MTDIGAPTSYLALAEGTPVVAGDGADVGTVRHVLAVPDDDIFDGLILDTPAGARFADASLVDALHERQVRLTLDGRAAQELPEPSERPSALSASPDDTADSELSRKLRRAWDYLSGNY
jgi:hypothetical protein